MTKTDAIERAFRSVADAFAIPVVELAGRKRYQRIAEARFALFVLLADDSRRNIADISRMLGRDERGIAYGIKRAGELAKARKDYAAALKRAMELNGGGA